MSKFLQRIWSFILTLILCLMQYGCQFYNNSSKSVVQDAIQLQIELTHDSLTEFLDFDASIPEVLRVKISSRVYERYEGGKLLSIFGCYYAYFSGSDKEYRSPFHLFLEPGEKGESWRLAKLNNAPKGNPIEWTSYPLPIID